MCNHQQRGRGLTRNQRRVGTTGEEAQGSRCELTLDADPDATSAGEILKPLDWTRHEIVKHVYSSWYHYYF